MVLSKTGQDNPTVRDNYHHGDLRKALLICACEYLREKGTDTLSLRALAREVGVSPRAPYRHFVSRNALFAGIASFGLEILQEELEAVEKKESLEPKETLVEMGLVYMRFALAHPEKYKLILNTSLLDSNEYTDLMAARGRCFNILVSAIIDGQRLGIYREGEVEKLAALIWSGFHGAASLVQIATPIVPEIYESPAASAIKYLAEEQKEVVIEVLKVIEK